MITNTHQDWSIGQQVKVGWTRCRVLAIHKSNDGLPDKYLLESATKANKFYQFIPHYGLHKLEQGSDWRI